MLHRIEYFNPCVGEPVHLYTHEIAKALAADGYYLMHESERTSRAGEHPDHPPIEGGYRGSR